MLVQRSVGETDRRRGLRRSSLGLPPEQQRTPGNIAQQAPEKAERRVPPRPPQQPLPLRRCEPTAFHTQRGSPAQLPRKRSRRELMSGREYQRSPRTRRCQRRLSQPQSRIVLRRRVRRLSNKPEPPHQAPTTPERARGLSLPRPQHPLEAERSASLITSVRSVWGMTWFEHGSPRDSGVVTQ